LLSERNKRHEEEAEEREDEEQEQEEEDEVGGEMNKAMTNKAPRRALARYRLRAMA
jgi:hypothetical protein